MAKASQSRRAEPARGASTTMGPARLALADAMVGQGRGEAAIRLYEAALAADANSSRALRGLARARLEAGRAAEAFQAADRALALDRSDAEAWALVGETLEALGELTIAIQAFGQALALGLDTAAVNLRAARLCERLDDPQAAAVRYARVLDIAPEPAEALEAHLALSGLYGRALQFAQSRAHIEAALAIEPMSRAAHQNLAVVCEHEGRADEAEAHRARAFSGAPLIVSRAAEPRRRVLMLASATRANSPDVHLIPQARYDRLVWFLNYGEPALWPDYDVVFNAVADADAAAALAPRLAAFAARCDKPLLNPPERIAATARDRAAVLFAGLDDLVIPQVRRIASAADVEGEAPGGDWLLRPVGSHGGERLERLAGDAIAARLADAGPHYLTAFHDCRSEDGLYRKYRMFFVDRQPFAYHMAASADWLVHYQTSLTPQRADLIAEERAFLDDPEAALGARAFRAISEAGRRMDLDFAGIDFAVDAQGRALLFEANATMLAHPEAPDGPLAHKNEAVARIFAAFRALLERG